WLEEPFSVAIAPSLQVAAAVDSVGRYVLVNVDQSLGPDATTLQSRERHDPATKWHIAFSSDGQNLFILSDRLQGVGFEFDRRERRFRQTLKIQRASHVEGTVLALDPTHWRWARDVSADATYRVVVGGGSSEGAMRTFLAPIGIVLPPEGEAVTGAEF